jgi:hypothetical protein
MRWPFSLLLAFLLLALLVQALAEAWLVGRLTALTMFGLTILGTASAARPPGWAKAAMTVLTTLWLGLGILYLAGVGNALAAAATTFLAMVIGLAVLGLILRMLITVPGIEPDALAGAVFGYLLLAVVWSLFFLQVELWRPGSFNLLPEGGAPDGQLLYFSLVTITTLGYGEITAATPPMRLCAGLEAAQGALYIAILIGRIVGALSGRRQDE